jgi:hypothetical protein
MLPFSDCLLQHPDDPLLDHPLCGHHPVWLQLCPHTRDKVRQNKLIRLRPNIDYFERS